MLDAGLVDAADTTVLIEEGIFNPAYLPHLADPAPLQIYFGGSSSGKSVFLAQRTVLDILQGGRNYLVCRQVADTIRKSVWNEVKKVITEFNLDGLFTISKSEFLITCANGFQILFAGLDDVQKIKSITPAKGVITDIWIEEATETNRQTVKELQKRLRGGDPGVPKRVTLSFNPIYKLHWIYEEYFKAIGWTDQQTEYSAPGISILKTWYVHNLFLTPQDVALLEGEEDEYFRAVYTLGNWGILGNVIFTNWRVEDLSGMRAQFTNRRHGCDFGFAADPAAVPSWHYDRMRKTIYIYDEIYDTDLTNDLLAAKMLEHGLGKERVTCDSAEPKSIRELKDHGINAWAARKGKDSVNHGIDWLKQQTIVVDRRCVNTQTELSLYKWKENRDGTVEPTPVDKFNHIMDALRYGSEEDMVPVRKPRSMRRYG